MPTVKPRYMVTDTGEIAEMLDAAQRAWPVVESRKELLLRLARAGLGEIAREHEAVDAADRQVQQIAAMQDSLRALDLDVLRSDEMWR